MKATIEVGNREEADAVKNAVGDKVIAAVLVIYGRLSALNPEEQKVVMEFVQARLQK